MKKIFAILPLRSGSDRIKDKNIRVVGYYPLFVHIIKTCLSINSIDKIIVSTDSKKYQKLINKYFSKDKVSVIIRPKNISDGDTKTEDVMMHVLNSMDDSEFYENVLLVQATTPLTDKNDIEEAIEKINEITIKSVFSVAKSKRFYLNDIEQIKIRPMTQNKKSVSYEAGCFWIVNIDSFKKERNRVIEPFKTVNVSERNALDIDTYQDLELVDAILSKQVRVKEKKYFKSRSVRKKDRLYYKNDNIDPDGLVRNILYEESSRVEFSKDEIRFINNHLKEIENIKRPKFLSIGLGGGYAENKISEKYEKYGIEPDINASKIASKYVDHLFNDTFENVSFDNRVFDVILAHHVIEHVENPIQFIKRISKIIRIGGKLVIGTPDFDSGAARRYGSNYRMLSDVTHISLFSEAGLRELLSDFGFIIDYVDYPYFDTKYFTKDNLEKMLDKDIVSPPFYGNIMTLYATKL
jgi:CMP-N-acetylneuraminic acid synthetase/2-polyprenyl-3-methyl-5-hydroxy-6-metoxy-1,4-benzoquinol methylase